MISKNYLVLGIFSILMLVSCEVFKTTPRSSRNPAQIARNSTAVPKVGTAPENNRNAPEVVKIARKYTGTPYRYGGNNRRGIDCSGLICNVYAEVGVKIPRISWQQSEFGAEVKSIAQIRPGDLVFFVANARKSGYVSHAGIVTEVRGKNDIWFIHASTSRGVREDNLYSTYFKERFVKAMRPI